MINEKEKSQSMVALVPCSTYKQEEVNRAVEKAFQLLGGVQNLLPEGKTLVKTNMLSSADPEKAITTHPSVFSAVLKSLKEAGREDITYGDSPGSPAAKVAETAQICGITPEAEKFGAALGNFDGHTKVEFKEGIIAKSFELCKAPLEADAIIEICKMKTHALENITGAVKNQYGFIYGTHKAMGHAAYPDSDRFARMLVDLNKCVKVDLHIMDGVIAMEGNGPASGNPTPMRVILMSKDPVALDSVFARLVYLDPALVPTCVAGEKLGLGNMNFENISLVTPEGEIGIMEAASRFGNADFDVNRRKSRFWKLGVITNIYDGLIGSRFQKPVVDLSLCIGCGICQEACPVEGSAVFAGGGKKARYDYKRCIRCYCCQEMCPEKAIKKRG